MFLWSAVSFVPTAAIVMILVVRTSKSRPNYSSSRQMRAPQWQKKIAGTRNNPYRRAHWTFFFYITESHKNNLPTIYGISNLNRHTGGVGGPDDND